MNETETKFRMGSRFGDFLTRWRQLRSHWQTPLLYNLIWIASFVTLILPGDLHVSLSLFVLIVFLSFWLKSTELLHQRVRPPLEVLIGIFFLLFLIELLALHQVYPDSLFASDIRVGLFPNILQGTLLALSVLIFSQILVQNSGGQKRVLLWYWLLALIGMGFLDSSGELTLLLVQAFLFVILLRKTSWLEELTKTECWIYLIGTLLLFRQVTILNPFDGVEASQFEQMQLWYTFPKFVYYLFKMYLLAVLVKIPVVLVYNFASLSRKLKISSLFQSTFPQFIQLVMLMIVFFFFVAGWQAEKIRQSLLSEIEQISSGNVPPGMQVFQFPDRAFEEPVRLPGYEPVSFEGHLPDYGMITLAQADDSTHDNFLFLKSRQGEDSVYFAKLDSTLLASVTENTRVLTGSQLLAYSYDVPPWEAYLYDLMFWREAQSFLIFPFGLRPHGSADEIAVAFETAAAQSEKWLDELETAGFGTNFTLGRVITPLYDVNLKQARFFAFEIVLRPTLSLFTPTLLSYLALLALVYFLVNYLVIRRMAKFGSEINRMIVQKFDQLKTGIREISAGNLDHKVKVEGRDEFVELATHFNQMGDRLKESIEEAREKERLAQELKIARQVQLDLLPRHLPEIPGFDTKATMKTANEVGGDFYDVLTLGEEQYLFTIGDVSGKGTSAAFYMAQCISLIRYSPQFTDQPEEIVARLNNYFSGPGVDRQLFVTAIVGKLDASSNTVELVRAGHTPPIFIPADTSDEIRELRAKGLGIGLERSGSLFSEKVETQSLTLQPGDKLLFYTDGLVEAAQTEKPDEAEFYGEERLMTLLQEHRSDNADALFGALVEDVAAFYNGRAPVDDYTLLVIQRETSS